MVQAQKLAFFEYFQPRVGCIFPKHQPKGTAFKNISGKKVALGTTDSSIGFGIIAIIYVICSQFSFLILSCFSLPMLYAYTSFAWLWLAALRAGVC